MDPQDDLLVSGASRELWRYADQEIVDRVRSSGSSALATGSTLP
jgi:hypothetical protein